MCVCVRLRKINIMWNTPRMCTNDIYIFFFFYGLNKFLDTPRLTTCQFPCLTAAIKSVLNSWDILVSISGGVVVYIHGWWQCEEVKTVQERFQNNSIASTLILEMLARWKQSSSAANTHFYEMIMAMTAAARVRRRLEYLSRFTRGRGKGGVQKENRGY